MPGDGPGPDDGGGEEAGWAWGVLRLLRNGEGCCYNITLPDVHGSIASKRGKLRGCLRAALMSSEIQGGRVLDCGTTIHQRTL
jgi:hypothetical protein